MNLPRVFFLIVIALISLSPAPASPDIVRDGRKIQLDGFLMDWIEKKRQAWKGSARWSWDAVNTEEGVAGYFHAADKAPCSSWVFMVDAGLHGPREMVVSDAHRAEDPLYRVNLNQSTGGQSSVIVEWLMPWDLMATDGSGSYSINIRGKSACGDSLEPVLLSGKKRATSPIHRFTERIVLIMVLLAVFIILQIKIRKKTLRKGSPRRSA